MSSSRIPLSCERQMSSARSQADQMGWRWVSGSFGQLRGQQSLAFMILSARRKFLKRLATSKSCLKSFWKVSRGRVFQAIVSVIAVKIQFSSPSMVLRSPNWPGIFSSWSRVTSGARWWPRSFLITNHLSAILMGVVRQVVNRSAGRSGVIGSSWSLLQAASWMQVLREGGEPGVTPPASAPLLICSTYSLSCCSAKFLKLSTMIPALLQSQT